MVTKTQLSTKNTKNEILDAYNELLDEVQKESSINREQKYERQTQSEILKVASKHDQTDVIHHIADLKVNTGKLLDELGNNIVTERDKLKNLQEAIKIESARLESLHGIIANADSLEALILANKQHKENFEKEMAQWQLNVEVTKEEHRKLWKKEKEEYDIAQKELELANKKERERKVEEHEYQFKLRQQKDSDNYEILKLNLERELTAKKETVEQELGAREAAIYTKEKEFTELKESCAKFDEILQNKIKETKEALTTELERKYAYEKELRAQETAGEISLLKQTIASFEDKQKEKQAMINEYTKQVSTSQSQTHDLAKKVIEGASSAKIFSMHNETKELKEAKDTKSN